MFTLFGVWFSVSRACASLSRAWDAKSTPPCRRTQEKQAGALARDAGKLRGAPGRSILRPMHVSSPDKPPATPLFLGVDGGGTKTEFLLAPADGSASRRLRLGGGNASTLGPERAADMLADGIRQLTDGLPLPAAAFFGLAGAGADGNGERVAELLRERFPSMTLEVGPDIRCVIEAAGADDGCVAAILGTGSCVYADDGDALHRYGGWGWRFDGAGSGFDLGRDAIQARLAFDDGIGPGGPLAEAVAAKLGRNAFDCLPSLQVADCSTVAAFAPLVFEAIDAGDPVARDILARNITRIAALVRAARAQHPAAAAGPLVLGGGLCRRADLLGPALTAALGPHAPPLVLPTREPVFGAHRRAVKLGRSTAPYSRAAAT